MTSRIFQRLTCPNCSTGLNIKHLGLSCPNCHKSFRLNDNVVNLLCEDKVDKHKKKEMESFGNLGSYQELMSRPYFRVLKEKITNSLRRYRFRKKLILEIGAGTSEFLSLFEKENELAAIDISEALLRQTKTSANLIVGDAENLPFLDGSFDFVYLIGVLHHLEDQKKALMEIKRVLKVRGKVFISEPTKWSLNLPYYLARKLALKIIGVNRLADLIGCFSPDESFISLKAIREVWGSDFQLKLQKVLPIRMPPVKFLEKLFPTKLNDLFEKTPLIKDFGSIVLVEGEKKGERR